VPTLLSKRYRALKFSLADIPYGPVMFYSNLPNGRGIRPSHLPAK